MNSTEIPRSAKGRRGRRRGEPRAAPVTGKSPVWPGVVGGLYHPLSDLGMERVHQASLDVLANVGMAQVPDFVVRRFEEHGAHLNDEGRLLFPRSLVEDAIAGFRRDIVLHGQRPGLELELSGSKVYVGTGGAAPSMVDLETGDYRDSTLRDLYDAARVVDALENIHFFSRPVVARDMETLLDFDVNTTFACLVGTSKHVMSMASDGAHVKLMADMAATIAGSKKAFDERPFLSLNVNHVVPPMRFIEDPCAVMEQAALLGIPMFMNSTGQAGASSPTSLAGCVVQAVVETLAGMIYTWLVNPDCRVIFGPRPLITDLRTGAMTGGCGEQAVAMAAGAQMGQFYKLSNSCIAGATDSKIPDAQSGYEKALTVALAAHAGSYMVTKACGMHAALMGCSLESYVIDNDMSGTILRSVRGIEIDDVDAAESVIAEVVRGDGHFLGHPDTMARMETDYLYPAIADRRSADDWSDAGSPEIREPARDKAHEILATHFPSHVPLEVEEQLRRDFVVHLDPASMGRGT